MQKRSLTILAVVAVVAAAAALWLSGERRAVTETDSAGALVPGLQDQLNDVTRVVVRGSEETITLERGESSWSVAERGGYPANMQNLRQQLMALANADRIEKKTANPDNYSVLGVEAIDASATGTEVTLEGLAQPVQLILGKQNYQGGASTYVRMADDPQSWLVSGNLRMEAKASSWLRKDVINIPATRISKVTLRHPDGSELTILKNRQEDPNFLVMDIPDGRELLSPSSGNSIAGALASLRLDDVQPAAEMDEPEEGVIVGVFETFDGLRATTRAWQKEDKSYVALSVAFDPSIVTAESDEAEQESGADSEAAAPQEDAAGTDASGDEATGDDGTDVEEEATTLQQSVAGWVFEIPSYKFTNMSKTLEDLLKTVEAADQAVDTASGG